MKSSLRGVSIVAVSLLLGSGIARAQGTAELNGTVRDESAAVLPGVTVTVTQTDTGFTRTVVTDGSGSYVIPTLPTGPYKLEMSLQGFRTYADRHRAGRQHADQWGAHRGQPRGTLTVKAAAPLVDVQPGGRDVVERTRMWASASRT